MAAPEALIETWCLYGVGSLIIFARIGARWRIVGLRGFKPDDYIVVLSWVTYTVMTVAADIVGGRGDLHALTVEQRKALTKEDAESLVYGTQWFCAGVATYILFIWTLKLNMLFLYQRVVKGLWVERLIIPTMCFVVVTFITSYLILFLACRPFHRMWTILPDQGPLCQPQSKLNMVPPLAFNLFTDICIMAIPAPVVIPVRTTMKRRIALLTLFGAGTFIMIAAILRVTMVLVVKNGSTAAIWSCREDFVAIVVGQAIPIRPMLTKNFWTGRDSKSSSQYSHRPTGESNQMGGSIELGNTAARRSNKSKNKDPFSITAAMATVNEEHDDPEHRNRSTDNIINKSSLYNDDSVQGSMRESSVSSGELEGGNGGRSPMVIHVSKQFHVKSGDQAAGYVPRPYYGLSPINDAACWTGEYNTHNNSSRRS